MASVMEYKCPCCGGIVEFNSVIQQMKCPYCDTVFDVEQMQGKDDSLGGAAEGCDTDGMGVYTCGSCGGELVADENTAATHCPFCGNPVMLTGRLSGEWRPDFVIPFQNTKEDAKAALRGFMEGKKLLPKKFRSESRLDEIKGIYVPFWLYDAETDVHGTFECTNRRTYRQGNWEYTETQYFDVERAGTMGFENVPVDGSEKMPADMMESIEPYDYAALKPFQTAYLSGYLADKYDVDSTTSAERANERIKNSAVLALRATVNGYSSVTTIDSDVQIRNARPKYALMPVWLLTTSWQDQTYRFAMNGQTGKFVGSLPVDKKTSWLWHLLYTGIFGGILWLILHFIFKL